MNQISTNYSLIINCDRNNGISKKRMEEKNFRGVDRIVLELQSTSKNVRVGLIPEGKQPIRTGSRIFINSNIHNNNK